MPLNAGDIAIIGYNADAPDTVIFVALVAINAGEVISFTDNSWTGTALSTNEGILTWTSPASVIAAGTVVTISRNPTGNVLVASVGTIAGSGGFDLSGSGDQILAYQGASTSPAFLAGLTYDNLGWITTGAVTTNTSYLPSALAGLNVNLSSLNTTGDVDNASYTGAVTSGTAAQLWTAFQNQANYTGSETVLATVPGNFTVSGGSDTTAPTLSSTTPLDDAGAVVVGSNIVLNFDEAVQMVTAGGAIEIRLTSDNSLVESFTQANVGGTVAVTGSTITLNPTADLTAGTAYYVTVASNAVEDTAGNDFAGFTAPTTLNFTTSAAVVASISINDVSIAEGNSGTQVLTFTVTRSNDTTAFSIDFATADGTATTVDADYVTATGTLSFTVGGALTQTVSVTINGDTAIELNETLALNLANIVNATGVTTFSDNSGLGTITGDDYTRIFDIQGASHRSSFVAGAIGTIANSGAVRVTAEGVITAITTSGFYMQDATGDGNIATSDGIFVFLGAAPAATLAVGDVVRVANARVDEFRASNTNNLTATQLNASAAATASLGTVTEIGTGTITSTIIGAAGRMLSTTTISDTNFAVFNPAGEAIDFWESLEGMLVTVDNPIAISGTADFSSNNEIWVVAEGAFDASSLNSNGGLTISATDQNPERIQIDDLITSLAFPDVTAGARLGDITGVVNYDFGVYEVLTGTATQVLGGTGTPTVITPGVLLAPETSSTITAVARQLSIGNYNLENLDALDPAIRFTTFANQIVNVLNAPTILACQEVQDNNGPLDAGVTAADLTALALTNAITAAGGPAYAYIDVAPMNGTAGGEPVGNIRPAFFYRADLLQIVGSAISLNVTAFDGSRDPLVVTFRIIESGVEFTLINNHLTSRGADNGLFGNVQQPVLNSEAGRVAQAQVINTYIDGLLATNANANIVVMGDMNDFGFGPAVQTIIGGATPVLTNLADELITNPNDRYSYIFNGNSQELDHMLASTNATSVATAFDIVHVNADFGRLQSSDHDPTIALFDARQLAETLTGSAGTDTIMGFGGNDRISTLGGDDVINGGAGADTILGGAGNDVFYGLDGADSMVGGADNDTYFVENTGDIVVELSGEGTDTVYSTVNITLGDNAENLVLLGAATNGTGTSGNDNLYGNSATGPVNLSGLDGNDLIYGGSGADTLNGGAGADSLLGLGGNDSLVGGDGDDIYVVESTGSQIVETTTGGLDYVYAYADYTLSDNLEALILLGGATNGTGTAGNDSLYGHYATGPVSISGLAGDDFIYGSVAGDTILGGAGADTLIGLSGNDSLLGGDNDDVYLLDDAGDTVFETATGGNDLVYANVAVTLGDNVETLILLDTAAATGGTGNAGNNSLYGNYATGPISLSGLGGNDLLYGGASADTLNGGTGSDTFVGLGGNDTMIGGADDDLYLWDDAGDTLVELLNEGFDSVYASVNATLSDHVEQLILIGAATTGTGSAGNNNLYGHNSSNAVTLDGAGGDDYLLGSGQNDIFIGGSGNDGFDFRQVGDDTARYNADGMMGDDAFYGFDADVTGGQDIIDLGGRGYTAGDIDGSISRTDLGANTLISFTSGSLMGTSIFLYDVVKADLSASDFLF